MKQLRKQRLAFGLSQQRLASACGMPRWKIAWAETNRYKLSSDELNLLRDEIRKHAAKAAALLAA